MEKYQLLCPVCGAVVEEFEICETCNWQNTGPHNVDGGPNKMTLSEAKEAWEKQKQIN